MAKVVICPSCQTRGSVPDETQGARIRCPKCGTVYKIGGESASATGPAPVAGRPSVSGPGYQRVPAAAAPAPPPRSSMAGPPTAPTNRVMLFALLGVSGLSVLLLGVVLALVLARGGGPGGATVPQPDATGRPVAAAPQPKPADPGVAPAVPPADLIAKHPDAPAAVAPTSSTKLAVAEFGAGHPEGAADLHPAPAALVPDRAQPPDPHEILRRLKDATVLIYTKIGRRIIGNGSGFVIEVNGDQALVATNRHVVVTDPSELPPGLLPKGVEPSLEAVFRSGSGRDEQALPARVIAMDLSGDLSTDLAFVVVQGLKNPPRPIDPLTHIQPIEGMSYVGAGFPLAGVIKVSENEGKPSVVITGGRISSFKRDEFGHLLVLQVDGSLQPGNSGGPIIDEKSGRLLGVAVAKARSADTIGFIVPAEQVCRDLQGQVGGLNLTLEATDQGKARLLVKANLVDPKALVTGVVVRAAPVSAVPKLTPDSDGYWPALPNTQPVQLTRDARSPSATGRIEVALNGTGTAARKVLIQAAHRDARGRLFYTRPREVFLPDQAGPIRDSAAARRMVAKMVARSLALLGPLVDPNKDCRLDKDTRTMRVRIDIPGKLHTLSPEILKNKTVPVHNAPMTLADVDGDFRAQVDVVGEISPGSNLPTDRAVRGLRFTFQSAGLILYQDKNNFVRLERAASILTDRLTPVHRLIVEVVQNGKQAIRPIYLDIPEGNTELIMMRRNRRFRFLFVPAGTSSLHTFREFALDFPGKVKVGLVASNISAQPFTAKFGSFALISDATQIDAGLEDE